MLLACANCCVRHQLPNLSEATISCVSVQQTTLHETKEIQAKMHFVNRLLTVYIAGTDVSRAGGLMHLSSLFRCRMSQENKPGTNMHKMQQRDLDMPHANSGHAYWYAARDT